MSSLQDRNLNPLVNGGLVELICSTTDHYLSTLGTARVVQTSATALFHGQPIGHGNITVTAFQPDHEVACDEQTAWHSAGNAVVQGQTRFSSIGPEVEIKVPTRYTKASSQSPEAQMLQMVGSFAYMINTTSPRKPCVGDASMKDSLKMSSLSAMSL